MHGFYSRFLESAEKYPAHAAIEVQRSSGELERHTYTEFHRRDSHLPDAGSFNQEHFCGSGNSSANGSGPPQDLPLQLRYGALRH
jgi:hypothetical protein